MFPCGFPCVRALGVREKPPHDVHGAVLLRSGRRLLWLLVWLLQRFPVGEGTLPGENREEEGGLVHAHRAGEHCQCPKCRCVLLHAECCSCRLDCCVSHWFSYQIRKVLLTTGEVVQVGQAC